MLVAPVENSWFSGGESPLSLNLLKVFRGRFQVKLLKIPRNFNTPLMQDNRDGVLNLNQ